MDIETITMGLIAHSGNARSLAFEALDAAKEKNFEESKKLINESQEESTKAHQVQTDLLINEANGNNVQVNLLLIHAQDHLMTSMLAIELIKEIIELRKEREE